MPLFWLSFATEEKFLGVAFITAPDLVTAVKRSWVLGINPGGCEVLGPEISSDNAPAHVYAAALANQNRLLLRPELDALFGNEASRVADFEDENDVEVVLPASHYAENAREPSVHTPRRRGKRLNICTDSRERATDVRWPKVPWPCPGGCNAIIIDARAIVATCTTDDPADDTFLCPVCDMRAFLRAQTAN